MRRCPLYNLCHLVKSRPKYLSEMRSCSENVVLIWVDMGLGLPLPLYSVQMRGRSRGMGNLCLTRFLFPQHKLICEGLERALLRMHRSILTVYLWYPLLVLAWALSASPHELKPVYRVPPPFARHTLRKKRSAWVRVQLYSFYDQERTQVILLVEEIKLDVGFQHYTFQIRILTKLVVIYMRVTDSVQPWICTFLCSYFYLCALNWI